MKKLLEDSPPKEKKGKDAERNEQAQQAKDDKTKKHEALVDNIVNGSAFYREFKKETFRKLKKLDKDYLTEKM